MKEKKDYSTLIFVCIMLLCILALLFLYKGNNTTKEDEKKSNYVLLNDYSRFFTINSCIYKYFSYLSNKNTDNLLSILDKEYITLNSINSDNIYEKTLDLNSYYSFISKKIYYRKISESLFEYYVYGYTEEENNFESDKAYYYFIVKLDENNSTFSITPINSELFKEASNE